MSFRYADKQFTKYDFTPSYEWKPEEYLVYLMATLFFFDSKFGATDQEEIPNGISNHNWEEYPHVEGHKQQHNKARNRILNSSEGCEKKSGVKWQNLLFFTFQSFLIWW